MITRILLIAGTVVVVVWLTWGPTIGRAVCVRAVERRIRRESQP